MTSTLLIIAGLGIGYYFITKKNKSIPKEKKYKTGYLITDNTIPKKTISISTVANKPIEIIQPIVSISSPINTITAENTPVPEAINITTIANITTMEDGRNPINMLTARAKYLARIEEERRINERRINTEREEARIIEEARIVALRVSETAISERTTAEVIARKVKESVGSLKNIAGYIKTELWLLQGQERALLNTPIGWTGRRASHETRIAAHKKKIADWQIIIDRGYY